MQQRAGDEQAVALPAGEGQPTGHETHLQAARHREQVRQEADFRERGLDLADGDVRPAEPEVLEQAGGEDILRTQDHDLTAVRFQVPRTQVQSVHEDRAGGRLAHAGDEVDERAATAALRAAQGHAAPRRHLEGDLPQEFAPAGVGEADAPQGDRRPGRGARRHLPTLAVGLQVDEMAELVHGGQRVVPSLELLAELGDGGHDGAHDEFARDELAERELLAEHQAATDDQERGGGEHLEGQQPDDLAHQHPEMPAAVGQVAAGELIGARRGERQARRALEKAGITGHLLQPSDRRVFAARLGQAGRDRAASEHENHERQPEEDDEHVGQQERVVEAQHEQTHHGADDDVDAVEQEHGRALLHGDHVKEAVDHLGRMDAVEGLGLHARQAPGHVGRETHEDAALDVLRDDVLQAPDHGRKDETAAEREGDEDQRLLEGGRLRAEGEVADDPVDRQRQREVQQTGDQAEDEDGRDVGDLGAHQAEQAADGRRVMAVRVVVATGQPIGRERGGDERGLDLGLRGGESEPLDQRGAAEDAGLLIAGEIGHPLAEQPATDDDDPAGGGRVDDQRHRGPGLPERRSQGHPAHIGPEAGGGQGGGDAFHRLLVPMGGQRPGDTHRVDGQPSLPRQVTDEREFRGGFDRGIRGRHRRTSHIPRVSHRL